MPLSKCQEMELSGWLLLGHTHVHHPMRPSAEVKLSASVTLLPEFKDRTGPESVTSQTGPAQENATEHSSKQCTFVLT